MKLPMRGKSEKNRAGKPQTVAARLLRLERENARLRKRVARLRGFQTMAYRDALTGLWNRRYFEERLQEEFSRSERAGIGRCFSVVVVDVNDFKDINDRHGHLAGDGILKWVGAFLSNHLRAHDIPCRTGGDEFMVLLPEVSSRDAAAVIERLRAQLACANVGREVPVSLSIGAASWPEVSKSCEMMLARADAAMYEDKRSQRTVVRFDRYRTAA
jgi:diguanylate cyclase (GGDEF)-like protein